jgi:hypothetical protein
MFTPTDRWEKRPVMKPLLLPWLAAVLLCSPCARAQENTTALDIGVRSGIDRGEHRRRKHDLTYARDQSKHQNIYLLASVSPHPSVGALVAEVNAIAIARELDRQLQAHGFKPVAPDQKPQIVITVEYGRGWLPNPYSDDDAGKMHNNLTNSDVFHPWPLNEIFPSIGNEMKRQKADQEKLIIQVRAWRYTPDPKADPLLLWMTTMNVDDPDHRDLNDIYPKLLAAGAPHFDQPIDHDHEVIVRDEVPEGRVNVGPLEVVKEPKTK